MLPNSTTGSPLNFSFFDWYYAAADMIIDQRGDLGKKPDDGPKKKYNKHISNMSRFYREG